jgi:hypothetical protein
VAAVILLQDRKAQAVARGQMPLGLELEPQIRVLTEAQEGLVEVGMQPVAVAELVKQVEMPVLLLLLAATEAMELLAQSLAHP